jgi:hypothetical protein
MVQLMARPIDSPAECNDWGEPDGGSGKTSTERHKVASIGGSFVSDDMRD